MSLGDPSLLEMHHGTRVASLASFPADGIKSTSRCSEFRTHKGFYLTNIAEYAVEIISSHHSSHGGPSDVALLRYGFSLSALARFKVKLFRSEEVGAWQNVRGFTFFATSLRPCSSARATRMTKPTSFLRSTLLWGRPV